MASASLKLMPPVRDMRGGSASGTTGGGAGGGAISRWNSMGGTREGEGGSQRYRVGRSKLRPDTEFGQNRVAKSGLGAPRLPDYVVPPRNARRDGLCLTAYAALG